LLDAGEDGEIDRGSAAILLDHANLDFHGGLLA
jgi:hypothetical protein